MILSQIRYKFRLQTLIVFLAWGSLISPTFAATPLIPLIKNPRIIINSGEKVTKYTEVSLTLSASNSPSEMYVTNNSNCYSGGVWEPFSPTKSWTIANTNPVYKSVYFSVKYRNRNKVESSCANASIIHDSICEPPSVFLLTQSPGRNTTPTLRVQAARSNDTTSLYLSNDCSGAPIATKRITYNSRHALNTDVTTSPLSDGDYFFSAKSVDDLGNVSNCSTVKAKYTVDTTPPDSPDISINNGAAVTNSSSVSLKLSASGSPVQFYVTKNADCSTGGSWRTVVLDPLWKWESSVKNGLLTAYVKYRDSVGNVSDCVSSSITVDTTAPSLPSEFILVTTDSNISNNQTPTIRVSGVNPEDRVSLHTDRSCSFANQKAYAIATDTSIDLTTSTLTTDGEYSFYAKITDLAGNSICSKDTVKYKLRRTPTVVAISSPSNLTFVNQKSSVSSFPVNGTCSESGLNVEVTTPQGTNVSTRCNNGKWNVVLNLSNESEDPTGFIVTVKHTNQAAITAEATVKLIKDTTAPSVISITSPTSLTPINLSNVSAVSVSGTCSEPGTGNVRIYANSTLVRTLNCSNGGFNSGSSPLNFSSLSEGSFKLSAVHSDAAGNSTISSLVRLLKDTAAPTAPTILIGKGALYSKNLSVPLDLSAGNSPTQMFITNSENCNSGGTWEPYLSTKIWTLAEPVGTKTVSAKFRDAAQNESACVSDSIIYKTIEPSISINNKALYTKSTQVSLSLAGPNSPQEMYITNTANCTSGGTWEPYSDSKANWTISQSNSTATVYVKYRNLDLIESTCVNDTIIHDNIAPTAPNVLTLVTPSLSPSNNSSPTIQISDVVSEDTITLHTNASCSADSQKASLKATDVKVSLTSSSLSPDGDYTFYAKSTDLAGNESSCSIANLSYTFDTTPPTSPVITIEGGASSTVKSNVSL